MIQDDGNWAIAVGSSPGAYAMLAGAEDGSVHLLQALGQPT